MTTLLMVSACGESTLESEHVLVRNHTDLAHLYGITSIQGDVSIMADDVTPSFSFESSHKSTATSSLATQHL